MPRRRGVQKRKPVPDAKYHSESVARFINVIMRDGKKSLAERIVYDAIEQAGAKLGVEPLEAFDVAMNNVKPVLEVKSRRVGGATYQVPGEVRPDRRMSLAMRWIAQNARGRKQERTMADRLAGELVDAYRGEGGSVRKREETHRMAEANRAFAHYRW